jgi:hypothetical protein
VRFLALPLASLALAGGYVAPADRPALARAPTAQEQRLGAIATRLAQRPVRVRCGDPHSKEALGSVLFLNGKPVDYAILAPATCTALALYAAHPAQFDAAQCPNGAGCQNAELAAMALQSIFYVANQLGASLEQGKALGRLYWTSLYRIHGAQWPKYYSPDCRNGGRLDLRPHDPRWPE